MRKTLFFLICVCMSFGKFMAQETKRIITIPVTGTFQNVSDDDLLLAGYRKIWYGVRMDERGIEKCFTITTCEDTVLQGKTYAVVRLRDENQILKEMLYRQEKDLVFRWDSQKQADILLYDFGLRVGDVFVDPDGTQMKVVEESLDSSLFDWFTYSNRGKSLRLQSVDNTEIEDVWIEGIGSVNSGIFLASELGDSHIVYGNIASDDINSPINFAIFKVNNDCYKNVLLNNDYIQEDEIYKFGFDCEFLSDTLHVYGILPINVITNLLECTIDENNNVCLNILELCYSDWPTGKVNRKYDVRIPGFKPGTYNVCLTGYKSGIRIGEDPYYQFKELFGTTQVVCTQVNNINHIDVEKQNGTFTDLTGRRLSSTPQHGIYIQDGRKMLK